MLINSITIMCNTVSQNSSVTWNNDDVNNDEIDTDSYSNLDTSREMNMAIAGFIVPDDSYTRLKETVRKSVIGSFGVRVFDKSNKNRTGWYCLANDTCQTNQTFVKLVGTRTSNASAYLSEKHRIT